ncbi:type II toxin-antitoxin system RelE/ParE family toxin [Photorhabdus heterorhabditis]|uniref:Type II toxin-antitoxin system RelE/ParE family toxin n=1 Tax=Photorhabdus heterorhabditis TaxID=880156 RepID=A0A5B0VIX2_9GAMM|nr:type II toxin-antitoxin system RelE/ParE family toxin [Photorhabdus heterorhabditis]KAA1174647.1 type II toxin-antitoxin system RelE/ParE family toxin [Photorhabdus heterorhabditis]MBS9441467.1 type II toxin-antitoxin system RelE/ParE family toxin [Photorhabdus heterorhabditis]
MFRVIYHDEAVKEADNLPKLIKVKYDRLVKKLEENPRLLREPNTKPLGDGLYEIRTMGGDIARGIWVYEVGSKIYMLRIFIKKTQQTPKSEIELAKRRLEEIKHEIKNP